MNEAMEWVKAVAREQLKCSGPGQNGYREILMLAAMPPKDDAGSRQLVERIMEVCRREMANVGAYVEPFRLIVDRLQDAELPFSPDASNPDEDRPARPRLPLSRRPRPARSSEVAE